MKRLKTPEQNPPSWPASVTVFGPDDAGIADVVNAAFATNGGHEPANHGEFSTARYAFLFKPGSYSVDVPVGFYTQVLGLGASPDDVTFTGAKGVYCEEGDYVEESFLIDFDDIRYTLPNGTQIMRENAWQTGGASQMRCLDLYNGGAGTFYYDDVLIDIIGGCGTCCPFDTLSCVSDCASDSVSLDWSSFQTGAYPQGITIRRDGVDIATLPGDATTYQDVGVDDGVHDYEVIGVCSAATSWSTSCSIIHCSAIDNDTCSTALPLDIGVATPFDTTFALLDPAAPAFSCANGGSVDQWYTFEPQCDGVFNISLCGSAYDTAMEVFDGGVAPGDCAAMTLIECNDDSCGFQSALNLTAFLGNIYYIRISGFGGDRGAGTINIGMAEISGFSGFYDCSTGFSELAWDGAGFGPTYDEYEVLRNGVSIASGLPAGTTLFTDTAPIIGSQTYQVIGTSVACGLSTSGSDLILTAPDLTATDVIFRAELAGGSIDSAQALATALSATGRTPVIVEGQPDIATCGLLDPGISETERLWFCGGTYPNGQGMTAASAVAIAEAQALGIGIYVESGDAWGFDPIDPAFGSIDGIADGILDGDDTFVSMNGLDSTFGLDLSSYSAVGYNQDNVADNDWTDNKSRKRVDGARVDAPRGAGTRGKRQVAGRAQSEWRTLERQGH